MTPTICEFGCPVAPDGSNYFTISDGGGFVHTAVDTIDVRSFNLLTISAWVKVESKPVWRAGVDTVKVWAETQGDPGPSGADGEQVVLTATGADHGRVASGE